MGRKAKFDGSQVSIGHGKKAKKQSDPTFPKGVLGKRKDTNVLINVLLTFSCVCVCVKLYIKLLNINLFIIL